MMKVALAVSLFCICALWLLAFGPSEASAQSAVEYGGIVGSKPPPKSPDIMKGSDRIAKPDASRACAQKKRKSGQAKAAGKMSGPLIIEKRGGRYERVQ